VTRKCSTCQHIKRAEIDRRLAAGEPGNQIARDYDLNPSSLHRHRVNCLGLSSSNAIMKEVALGTAAIICLPSKEELNNAYFELRARIDQIVSFGRPGLAMTHRGSGLKQQQTLFSTMRNFWSKSGARWVKMLSSANTSASRWVDRQVPSLGNCMSARRKSARPWCRLARHLARPFRSAQCPSRTRFNVSTQWEDRYET
jgi:hypothetical protein